MEFSVSKFHPMNDLKNQSYRENQNQSVEIVLF